MIITVASGKGGTGKTTIATNLAWNNAQAQAAAKTGSTWLIDCDVEEPNAALFIRPTFKKEKKVERLLPIIDHDQCTGCGVCVDVCEYNALAVAGGKTLFFKELCHACGSCVLNCPEHAIHEISETIGLLQQGSKDSLQFAHGILEVGFSSPTPIIRDLKKWIIPPQPQQDSTFILDASPGTACPVVESFRGADFALLVTEPTPFGLHDLTLVAELIQNEFKIPSGIVINKSGRGDEIIEQFASEKKIPILMRVPLSRAIAEAYAKGTLLVDAFPQYKDEFTKLHKQIGKMIQERQLAQ
ncbi:MAG: ATP-binding protein [Anaerolineaceae bacterium]|nr:ATP-binding protein [Anaerolineaceae bacterium]